MFAPLLEAEMSKKCTPFWREAHFEVKIMFKTPHVCATFGSWDVEKVHAVVAQSTFRSQNVQSTTCTRHFWRFRCRFAWQAQGIVHLGKSEQNVRVLWHFQKGWQACGIWRGSAKMNFPWQAQSSSELLGGEGGCILEHQILRFAKMILRDRCSTSYELASLFHGRRSTFDRWTGKIAKRIGTRPSALHSTFHFWRKSRRIALFLMLSNSKIEEVSQNCFVLDVVNFEKWSLAELLRFWRCQVQTLRKSRRIASFLTLSSSNIEEVSQNSFVFKLADRLVNRQTDRQRERENR